MLGFIRFKRLDSDSRSCAEHRLTLHLISVNRLRQGWSCSECLGERGSRVRPFPGRFLISSFWESLMSKKQYFGLLAVCGLMSLAGSFLFSSLSPVAFTAKAAAPQPIRSDRFELIDQDGQTRGLFQVDPEAGPQLILNGEEESKVVLSIDDVLGTPDLSFHNKQGISLLSLRLDDWGGEIIFSDREETRMVEIYVDEKSYGVIETLDAAGNGKLMAAGE